MHARELIEAAAVLATDARSLLEETPRLCDQALAEYWAASRCRLDEWGRGLRAFAHHPREASAHQRGDLAPLAHEVVLSQVLTRVVAALSVAHDRRHDRAEAGPVARSILAGHDEAIGRLHALAGAWWRPVSSRASRLRLMRQRAERWTDLLLGYVLPLCPSPGARSPEGHAIEFAFEPARAQEFAYDAPQHAGPAAPMVGSALCLGARQAFAGAEQQAAAPELNRRLAGAAIGLFGPEAFDSHGLLRSAWSARLERAADDTLGMIEGLFDDSRPPRARPPVRWRG